MIHTLYFIWLEFKYVFQQDFMKIDHFIIGQILSLMTGNRIGNKTSIKLILYTSLTSVRVTYWAVSLKVKTIVIQKAE